MRYAMLLKPHANTRYRQSLQSLALAELTCSLHAWGVEAEPQFVKLGGEPFLVFEAEPLAQDAWRFISGHSGCCFAAECKGELLKPLARTGEIFLPEEVSQILKYKGKTNADFTLMLLHCARCASDFARSKEPLTVLDPLCGKATTLFCALQEGDNAVGVDVDAKALNEAGVYFERLLKLHRFKHSRQAGSLTLRPSGSAKAVTYTVADTPQSGKRGETRTLRLINADLSALKSLVHAQSCHLVVGDLPYGVQHAPKEGREVSSLERLVERAASGCAWALKPGGAAAFSYNLFTLRRERVVKAMEAGGLRVLDEPPYNGFAHWVEQAVERDAVFARKEG